MTDTTNAAHRPGKLMLAIGAAAAAICAPFVSGWESGGKEHLVAYRDIVGVWTVCDGDTIGVTAATRETSEGCRIRTDARLAQFGAGVLKCVPQLKGRDHQLAAATSLAYNIGITGFCGSTAARRFRAGDWRGACEAFAMWDKAGGRVVRGLVRRRDAERRLCLTDLPR